MLHITIALPSDFQNITDHLFSGQLCRGTMNRFLNECRYAYTYISVVLIYSGGTYDCQTAKIVYF